MTEREKEIHDYYHGYFAALQDILLHWNENTPVTKIIDYHLETALEGLIIETKKITREEE